MIGVLASIVEAYGELRVNKGRVLLSLIGVAASVFAMTAVLGGGEMLSNSIQQSVERSSGRPAVITVTAMGSAPPERQDAAVQEALDRLGIQRRSRQLPFGLRVQTRQGVYQAEGNAVDADYGDMFRVRVNHGRWLSENDEARLSPVIVINERLYERVGRPPLGSATLTVYGQNGKDAANMSIIGVFPSDSASDERLVAYLPIAALSQLPANVAEAQMSKTYLAWVPPEDAEPAKARLNHTLRSSPEGPFDAYVTSSDLEDMGFREMEYGLLGVAGAILLLGALGLVNISLVTVRFRMREIGIRRSYGATGTRIFVGVLMESVVATAIAGAIGVTAAVALVRSPFVTDYFREIGLVDLPPFPVSAVLTGLAAAILVGALAGIVPALIATRIKVIDAIRA